MTYRYAAYDILTSLKNAFDDADIRISQVIYWLQVVANRIRNESVRQNDSGLYLSTFSSVSIQRDSKDRQYFDLPNMVMDLPNEGGIKYITYNIDTGCCCTGPNFAQVYFQPTTAGDARRLYGDEYEKPSTTNPYFYRVGDRVDGVRVDRIYLLGTECIEISDVEIGLLSTLNPGDVCNLDDKIPVPEHREEELMKTVLELGRFVIMMPNERINDGEDDTEERTPSVPDQPQPQPEQ